MDKSLQESDYLIAWLAFVAASTVLGGVVGGLFGAAAGSVLGAAGVDPSLMLRVVKAWAYLLAIPVSYGCFRLVAGSMVVKKVVAHVRAESAPTTAILPPGALTGEARGVAVGSGASDQATPLRHSGLGALSLACAALAAILYVALIVYLIATDFGDNELLFATIGLAIASGLGFFGLGVGVGSLYQSGRKRLVPVLGFLSSSLLVAVLALTWTIIGVSLAAFAE